jgi:serine/threonine protein kinase
MEIASTLLTWASPRNIVQKKPLNVLLPLNLIYLVRHILQASMVILESVGFETLALRKLTDHEPEQSRRDDMESLGYVLLYFLQGRLPWEAETEQKEYKLVMEKKVSVSINKLCAGVPWEIACYMNHVRALTFEEKPNYSYLRRIFWNLFRWHGFHYDNAFDWTIC